MALADWFEEFNKIIAVNNGTTISDRSRRITRRLNSHFWNTDNEYAHRFYAGSYGRNTAIRRVSDVDLVFELPAAVFLQYNAYMGNGQSALLQAVRQALLLSFPQTNIAADGQIVAIPFSDGNTFEIVPAFPNPDGTHIFADSNGGGSWKTMNPKAEIEALRTRNVACNENLVPLCRMMRAWRQENNVQIKGILIDTLAYQFIENYKYRDKSFLYYDFMCRDFFEYLANQDKEQSWWKAPRSGRYVWGGVFQFRAGQAYRLSVDAIEAETSTPKKELVARMKWWDVFGTEFP
jgi:hypothetical protein